MAQRVVMNNGMGADSAAILAYWDENPSVMPAPWSEIHVLSAQVGKEKRETKLAQERYIYPILRRRRARTIQVARVGLSESDGIVVLSDTREPYECFIGGGGVTIADELLRAGTVPQVAQGKRLCSLHWKGFPLDLWKAREFGDMPFVNIMGFNADEQRRIARDLSYSSVVRTSVHPLAEWGWGRARVESYLLDRFGYTISRSCCLFCPFSDGKLPMLTYYRAEPEDAAEALILEFGSICLNPRMTLYADRSLRSVLEADGNTAALALMQQRLDALLWSLYYVRRVYTGKGLAWRSVERITTGSRRAIDTRLTITARAEGLPVVEADGVRRAYRYERADTYPAVEAFLVAAPAVIEEKERKGFPKLWSKVVSSLPKAA